MIFLKLLSRLPLKVLYFFSDLLFVALYHFFGYRRTLIFKNLSIAFPKKSTEEIKKIRREYYKRFSDFSVEVLKSLTISKDELNRRVKFVNVPDLDVFYKENQSVVVLASHQFNWEWALLAGCLQLPFPIDAIYQKLNNRSFEKLMYDTRSRFGGRPIHKGVALREIIRTVDRLKALGIVADQSPHWGAPKFWSKFLNRETAFHQGSEQIPKITKYPTFFMHTKYIKRGHYEVKMIKIASPPYDKDSHKILENYIIETEKLIHEDPPGWLWSHNRWKYKQSEHP